MSGEDNRRSTDATIYAMSRDLGELTGTVKTSMKNQEVFNKNIIELCDKQDAHIDLLQEKHGKRIGSLESSRTSFTALFLAVSTLGGFIATMVGRWISGHHGN